MSFLWTTFPNTCGFTLWNESQMLPPFFPNLSYLLKNSSILPWSPFSRIMVGDIKVFALFYKLMTYLTTLPHPHTLEQNGVTEHRHYHIVDTTLSLLHYANLPLTYQTCVFKTAVYLINRLPTPIINNQSAFQLLFHQLPNYTKIKSFGCISFPWLRPYTTYKLQPRSIPCIFLGWSTYKPAYKCFDLITKCLHHSCHVEFVETNFPYHATQSLILPHCWYVYPFPIFIHQFFPNSYFIHLTVTNTSCATSYFTFSYLHSTFFYYSPCPSFPNVPHSSHLDD